MAHGHEGEPGADGYLFERSPEVTELREQKAALLEALKLIVDTGAPITVDAEGFDLPYPQWAISEKQRDIARAAIEAAEKGA